MKAAEILQVVIILLLLATAASCEISKEYSNRVFTTKTIETKKITSIKFLNDDSSVTSFKPVQVPTRDEQIKNSAKVNIPVTKETQPPGAETKGQIRNRRVRQ